MANYKPRLTHSLGTAGVNISVAEKASIKVLHDYVNNSNVADGFLDSTTGLIYQVPSGKTFNAVSMTLQTNAAEATMDIYQGDTENAVTLLKMTRGFKVLDVAIFACLFTIASTKFITYDPSGTGIYDIELIGYET